VSEPELAVVDKPEPEIEEPLIEISADLPAEFAMDLVPSLPAVRVFLPLRSSDLYDLLQIVLEAIGSQEFGFLMVQSTIGLVFSAEDLPQHIASVLFEVPSTATGWS